MLITQIYRHLSYKLINTYLQVSHLSVSDFILPNKHYIGEIFIVYKDTLLALNGLIITFKVLYK